MTKPRLTGAFRSQLSDKLMDLGNLVVAGLVIGQFVSDKNFSLPLLITGMTSMGLCYMISYFISR